MSVLIKQNGLYYSILPEFYDEELGEYIPLGDLDFSKEFSVDELYNGFDVDITPIMTSNTSPSPYVVSASSQYSTSYAPWRAFDNKNINGTNDCWLTNGGTKGWIQIDFGSTQMISELLMTSRNYENANTVSPKDFTLQGSNNGVDFDVIKSWINEVDWTQNETRLYILDTVVNYRYYKIDVTSNNGNGNYVGIGELRFILNTVKQGYHRPIEKFDNFTLVTQELKPYNYQAVKSSLELVVSSGDIPTYIADTLHNFIPNYSLTDGSQIKLTASIDKGMTWLTHDGSDFVDLNITIPLKSYVEMDINERLLFESNKSTVLSDGIDISELGSIDFNSLHSETLRFAYALYRPSYLSKTENRALSWTFNSIGSVIGMKRSESVCDVFSHGVNITSKIDSPLMMVNVFGSQILKENQGGEMPITDKITLDKPVLNVSDTGYMSWGLIDNAGLYKIYVNGNEVGETSDLQYQFDDMVDGELYVFVILAIPTDDENYNISPYSNSIVIDKR